MFEPDFWIFLSSALLTPVGAPLVLLLLPQWKISVRKQRLILLMVELIVVAESILVFLTLGASKASSFAVAVTGALTAFLFLIRYNSLRDGRLAFLLVTIMLNTTVSDVLTSTMIGRDSPRWAILYVVVSCVQYFLLYRFCRRPLHRMLETDCIQWGRFSLIPISLNVSLTVFHVHSLNLQQHRTAPVPAVCFCVTVILIYVTLYNFYQTLTRHAETLQYNALLQSEIHFLETQNNTARATEKKLCIFRHDSRHYLGLLQGCLEQPDAEAALEILGKIKELAEIPALSPVFVSYTGKSVIDTILNQSRELAGSRGVAFEPRLSFPKTLRVDEVELAVVLSNALENAIHAAEKTASPTPKKVCIQSKPCNQGLFLVISNTFSGALSYSEQTGLPSTQAEGHGYGTLSIYSFAQKYGCALDCAERNGMVYLRLLI